MESDLYAQRLREQMIKSGVIVPSGRPYRPGERPFLTKELVARLKKKLIREGILFPGDVYCLETH